MAITSYGYDGPITEPQMAQIMPSSGSALVGVVGAGDLKVTAGATAGQVNVAPGTGWGPALVDASDSIVTVTQASLPSSGSRWDLVALRRDWTPPGGVSSFVIITGSSTKQLPAALSSASSSSTTGRNVFPGVVHDQPLALVRWVAGYTSPQEIVDLRVWAANGGAYAKDNLVMSYLDQVGTDVAIGGIDWQRTLDANGNPVWVQGANVERFGASTTDSTWAYNVTLTRHTAADGAKTVTCGFLVARIGGGSFTVDTGAWTPILSGLVPDGWRPNDSVTGIGSYEFNGFGPVMIRFNTNGSVDARGAVGSVNMGQPTRLQVTAHWTCA